MEETRNLGWAIDQLKAGAIVARDTIDYKRSNMRLVLADIGALKQTMILVMTGKDEEVTFRFWQPNYLDIMAVDYYIFQDTTQPVTSPDSSTQKMQS